MCCRLVGCPHCQCRLRPSLPPGRQGTRPPHRWTRLPRSRRPRGSPGSGCGWWRPPGTTAHRLFAPCTHTAPLRTTLWVWGEALLMGSEKNKTAKHEMVKLTTGVSVNRAGGKLSFRFSGVAGRVRAGVESRQSLQHAEEAVGGRQLKVFLWDIADLTAAVPGLDGRRQRQSESSQRHQGVGKLWVLRWNQPWPNPPCLRRRSPPGSPAPQWSVRQAETPADKKGSVGSN